MSASYSAGGIIPSVDAALKGGVIHNNFVFIAIEIGWTGLLAWLWMLYVAAMSCYRTFRSAKDPFVKNLSLGIFCILLDYTFMHFFAPMLTAALIGFLIWTILGLVATLPALEAEAEAEAGVDAEPTTALAGV
jgi:O-antigen ligase